jgi:hypothetical protein
MFNNTLTNLEKKALLITLAHLSSEYTIHTYSAIYNKKTYKRITIENKNNNQHFDFNINNYFKCNDILTTILTDVFEEYNFVCNPINNDIDILNNFALLANGIVQKIKESYSSIISLNDNINNIIPKLQKISDYYTLIIHSNKKNTKNEKTCLVIVRHILDNIISGFLFNDGIELLDFINGTRIISELLCLNATLYDENTYYHFYQQYS